MSATSIRCLLLLGSALTMFYPAQAGAQQAPRQQSTRGQFNEAMALIRAQQLQLDRQAEEIKALRERLDRQTVALPATGPAVVSGPPSPVATVAQGSTPGDPASLPVPTAVPLERVGQAPEDEDRPIQIAVLDNQGSVVTRRGALTGELQFDYARADRNRAVFRGVELVEAVLVGVFDINESRQDVLTASASLRYGLTDRFEIGVRLPYVYRSDNSTKGNGIGDLEVMARYQLIGGGRDRPYVIGNLQAVFPTGSDPFAIRRDELGRALNAATGAGFYGITPSVTAVLPSDPVVLFGTLGYTFNLGKNVNTQIPPVIIERTTLNFGYAHTWAFGTLTRTRLIEPTPQWPGTRETTSRDLQIGRFLFGVTYRVNDRASVNWSVEVGATEDATDLRTVFRLPLTLISGR
jgi:hypothetical protein